MLNSTFFQMKSSFNIKYCTIKQKKGSQKFEILFTYIFFDLTIRLPALKALRCFRFLQDHQAAQ